MAHYFSHGTFGKHKEKKYIIENQTAVEDSKKLLNKRIEHFSSNLLTKKKQQQHKNTMQ